MNTYLFVSFKSILIPVVCIILSYTTVFAQHTPVNLGDNVAYAVVYLASDDADFVNGAALSVDDGMAVGGFGLA